MAYNDFWEMTPREYYNACNGYRDRVQRTFQTGWEQARWVATIVVNVNSPKKQHKPEELGKFPWEEGGGDVIAKTDIDIINERRKWRERKGA